MKIYSTKNEAILAMAALHKAINTCESRYTGDKLKTSTEFVIEQRFGKGTTLEQLDHELMAGEYDKLVGRSRQAAKAVAEQQKRQAAINDKTSAAHAALMAEMTARYCRA